MVYSFTFYFEQKPLANTRAEIYSNIKLRYFAHHKSTYTHSVFCIFLLFVSLSYFWCCCGVIVFVSQSIINQAIDVCSLLCVCDYYKRIVALRYDVVLLYKTNINCIYPKYLTLTKHLEWHAICIIKPTHRTKKQTTQMGKMMNGCVLCMILQYRLFPVICADISWKIQNYYIFKSK